MYVRGVPVRAHQAGAERLYRIREELRVGKLHQGPERGGDVYCALVKSDHDRVIWQVAHQLRQRGGTLQRSGVLVWCIGLVCWSGVVVWCGVVWYGVIVWCGVVIWAGVLIWCVGLVC